MVHLGFCFITFADKQSGESARKILKRKPIRVWKFYLVIHSTILTNVQGRRINVEWADPLQSSRVNKLFPSSFIFHMINNLLGSGPRDNVQGYHLVC